MSSRCVRAGFLLLAVAMGTAALGHPSLVGSTGLVQTPNTDTVPTGSFEFAADYVRAGSEGFSVPLRLVAGISETAELGIAFVNYGDGMDGRLTNVVGKLTLQRQPEAPFSLAIGLDYGMLGEDLFHTIGLNKALRLYAVASATLREAEGGEGQAEQAGPGVRLNAGLAYNRVEFDSGSTESATRPFVGVEFATARGTVLAFEWRSEKVGDDIVSAVVRYPFRYNVIQLGVTKNVGGLGVSSETAIFVGFGWHFAAPE
jgi:hypothetical protein